MSMELLLIESAASSMGLGGSLSATGSIKIMAIPIGEQA
jgi:hypothetical protein